MDLLSLSLKQKMETLFIVQNNFVVGELKRNICLLPFATFEVNK